MPPSPPFILAHQAGFSLPVKNTKSSKDRHVLSPCTLALQPVTQAQGGSMLHNWENTITTGVQPRANIQPY